MNILKMTMINKLVKPTNLPILINLYRFTVIRSFSQVKAPLLNGQTCDVNERKICQSVLKTPKGTKFYNPRQMLMRRSIMNKIIEMIKLFGAVEIETPLLELTPYLTEKGALDTANLYSFKDQGGEMLSLRYNLTVPFARYVAKNTVGKIRCYQVGRVCRRESTSEVKGTLRDFYQIDFNIAGSFDSMVPDSECIQLLHKVLTDLDLSNYILKVNHRKILNGIFGHCGVPLKKFRQIRSLIDKLEKIGWEEVRRIMVEKNGLDGGVADRIGNFVKLHGGEELVHELQKDQSLSKSTDIQEGFKELLSLYKYCNYLGCASNLVFDMGLARGLDYYTGVVFEAVVTKNGSHSEVNSVAGGGRYDKLVGLFDPRSRSVPCVGVSFGIERLFAIRNKSQNLEGNIDVDIGDNGEIVDQSSCSSEVGSQSCHMTEPKSNESKKIDLKTPKGMRDFHPSETSDKRALMDTVIGVFHTHGAGEIHTPAFEFKEVLTGKYGEDTKLIYDIEEREGETLSLKYDLTIPFARFLAKHKITDIKSYQIDTVHRRDHPTAIRGRFREFCQCDFDIAGHYDPMVPDAECIQLLHQVLMKLNLGSLTIKVNHRKVLSGVFARCGVPTEKFRQICSAVDKLDKMSWEDVRKEMVEEKGLDGSVADRIGEYVKLHGGEDLIHKLQKDQRLIECQNAQEGLKELLLLSQYCKRLECESSVVFDLGLSRGLDYYTGVIFEAVLTETGNSIVGSVAAGGRYDNLVEMFDPARRSVPCVGVSFGMERLFILDQNKKTAEEGILSTQCQVLVASPNKGLMSEVLKILTLLRNENIPAETCYKNKGKLLSQLQYAEENCIPLVLLIGKSEVKDGVVTLRPTETRKESTVERGQLLKAVKKYLETRLIQ